MEPFAGQSETTVACCISPVANWKRDSAAWTFLGYARAPIRGAALKQQTQMLEANGCFAVHSEIVAGARVNRPVQDALIEQLTPSTGLMVASLNSLAWREADLRALLLQIEAKQSRLVSITDRFSSDAAMSCFDWARLFDNFAHSIRLARSAELAMMPRDRREIDVDGIRLTEALREIRSGKLSVAKAADQLGIARSTLYRRYPDLKAA